MRAAGYQTAFVGKYINEYGAVKPVVVPPGWMDWHASVGGGHYFENRLRESTGGAPVSNVYRGPYQTDLYTDIAVDAIERLIGRPAPLFLWVSYFAPHQGRPVESDDPSIGTPAVAPRHRNDFAGTPLRGQEYDPSFNETDVSDKPRYIRNRKRLSSQLLAQMTESYQQRLESLLAVDEGIADILEALEDSGELANTVIVFTADNGYMMGEHRIHAGKTVPYDPSAQIPLIIRGPGFPAGVDRHQVTALIDLAPTFLELAGGTAGLPLDGMSLLPMAANPNFAAARNLVVEAGPRGDSADDPWFYRGIRTQRRLYLEYEETNEVEMYDLVNDPFQLRNVSTDPSYSASRALLASSLDRLRDCSGAGCR
jgi:arylsulfatase A-like enzyme